MTMASQLVQRCLCVNDEENNKQNIGLAVNSDDKFKSMFEGTSDETDTKQLRIRSSARQTQSVHNEAFTEADVIHKDLQWALQEALDHVAEVDQQTTAISSETQADDGPADKGLLAMEMTPTVTQMPGGTHAKYAAEERKALLTWLNKKVAPEVKMPAEEAFNGFRNGNILKSLYEKLYNKRCTKRLQTNDSASSNDSICRDNVNVMLILIREDPEMESRIKHISADEIVKGNKNKIFDLIWALIMRFELDSRAVNVKQWTFKQSASEQTKTKDLSSSPPVDTDIRTAMGGKVCMQRIVESLYKDSPLGSRRFLDAVNPRSKEYLDAVRRIQAHVRGRKVRAQQRNFLLHVRRIQAWLRGHAVRKDACDDKWHRKVQWVVEFLDADHDGTIQASEAKVLISALCNIPTEEIPDEHPEVQAFSNVSVDSLIAKIWRYCDDDVIERFFELLNGIHMQGKCEKCDNTGFVPPGDPSTGQRCMCEIGKTANMCRMINEAEARQETARVQAVSEQLKQEAARVQTVSEQVKSTPVEEEEEKQPLELRLMVRINDTVKVDESKLATAVGTFCGGIGSPFGEVQACKHRPGYLRYHVEV